MQSPTLRGTPLRPFNPLRGFSAFLFTVVAAYASTLVDDPSPLAGPYALPLLVLGAAYLLVGWVGLQRIGYDRPLWRGLVYFALQIPLTLVILYLSRYSGFISLLIFPLTSNAVEALPRRWALLVCVVMMVLYAAQGAYLAGGALAFSATFVVGAGMLFVASFTQLAVNERNARGEVERLAAELGTANQKLREYAAQVEELAIARERNRLAREIHDSLGHYLTVINVQLEAAQVLVTADPQRALEAMRKAQTLAQEGLGDVRRSVAALRAVPTERRPLPEAVEALAQEVRAAGVVTYLDVQGAPRPLAPQAELALYRAAQEALTNVRKHAHASRVDLRLDYGAKDGPVRLTVQDNGVGAPAGAAEANGGFGLLGLRERLQLVGGAVRLHTAPGEGFRVEVEVPG